MHNRPLVSIVDDDESVRESLPDLLRVLGFAAQAFSSAQEFLASGYVEQTRCLLLDVAMPGMSGPMMIDHLLTLEPNLRVLFMSGYDDRQVVQRYVIEKGFALIPKPFTLQSLGAFVKNILNGDASTGPATP